MHPNLTKLDAFDLFRFPIHRQGLQQRINDYYRDDDTAAGRSGNKANVSLGVAKKLSDTFAIAGEVTARFGEFNINQLLSSTDFSSLGMTLSGAFALNEQSTFSFSGFYEHGWFDTSLAGATGSYDVDRYGFSASLADACPFLGGFQTSDLMSRQSSPAKEWDAI